MSRIAKKPVELIAGAEINISGQTITAKGKQGNLSMDLHETVSVKQEDNVLAVLRLMMTQKAAWLWLVLCVHWSITWLSVLLRVSASSYS